MTNNGDKNRVQKNNEPNYHFKNWISFFRQYEIRKLEIIAEKQKKLNRDKLFFSPQRK